MFHNTAGSWSLSTLVCCGAVAHWCTGLKNALSICTFLCPFNLTQALAHASTTSSWPIRACGHNGYIGGSMDRNRVRLEIYLGVLSCRQSLLPRKTLWPMDPHWERRLYSAWALLVWSFFQDTPLTWCYQDPQTPPRWESFLQFLQFEIE